MLQALHEGVIIADGRGRTVILNDAAHQVLGIGLHVDIAHVVDRISALDVRRVNMTFLPLAETGKCVV